MSEFVVDINKDEQQKIGKIKSAFKWFMRQIVTEKFNNPTGYAVLIILSFGVSFLVAQLGFIMGIALIAGFVGVPMFFVMLFNLKAGTIIITVISFVIMFVMRMTEEIPLGTLVDISIALMLFGLMIKQIQERDWSFAKNPISKAILVWIAYNVFQGVNPSADSRLSWLYTIRSIAGVMVMYFIVMYCIDSVKFLKFLVKLWIGLALFGALYGLYQEIVGFLPFEERWVHADPLRNKLLFIWGHYRKFSFFSDPVVFGYCMAYTGLINIVLIIEADISKFKKLLLGLSAFIMFYAMLASGTRAAYVVVFVGLFFYTILSFNKRILAGVGVLGLFGLILIVMPTSNPSLKRFQSAFNPQDDPSYLVRQANQAMIRPFIQSHPLGGGLGATGLWGRRFSPNSFLSKFPPDSTFVRLAVEVGWIGLFLYLILYYTILHVGVKDYIRIKDRNLKAICAGMLTCLYSIAIASYPQQTTNQVPTSLLFFIAAAIINRARFFDKQMILEKEKAAGIIRPDRTIDNLTDSERLTQKHLIPYK